MSGQEADGRTKRAARTSARPLLVTALTALFVTSLITAQFTSSKIATLSLPLVGVVTLPAIGAITFPTGTFAYAGTFLATDVTGEVLGEDTARWMVNVGFLMNFVMLGFVWLAIGVPVAEGSGLGQGEFASVVGSSTNIVAGSLLAYIVSQNWDVFAFHGLRRRTDGDHLWLRNVLSTGTSQLLDTVLFTLVAFLLAPAVLGIGVRFSAAAIVATIVGQYVVKLAIALIDTPLVYAAVGLVRRTDESPSAEPTTT